MNGTVQLLQYQRLGDRVRTLTDEQVHLEARLARDEELESAIEAESESAGRQESLHLELKSMELEVESHRAKMKAAHRELMSGKIRNPSDLTKLSAEVDHMRERLAQEEDVELELMARMEAADSELVAARDRVAAARRRVADDAPQLARRLATIAGEVSDLEAQREILWTEVPAPLQAAYRRVRVPNPVVPMSDGQCEGCRVQLTANELQILRRGERYTCGNCNRILVLS
ncbi:MAG: C4-type zinc ribbon domain-containing protein [Candidatus Dormibacteraceae bacterium]